MSHLHRASSNETNKTCYLYHNVPLVSMIVNFVDCQSLLISNAMLKQVEK